MDRNRQAMVGDMSISTFSVQEPLTQGVTLGRDIQRRNYFQPLMWSHKGKVNLKKKKKSSIVIRLLGSKPLTLPW